MATLQIAEDLYESAGLAQTRLLLETSDQQRHELRVSPGRYDDANALVAALNLQMAQALPNGEARLNETKRLALSATRSFRLAPLTSQADAALYGSLPSILGMTANSSTTQPYTYRVQAAESPRALWVLPAIAKFEPKSLECSETRARGRGGAVRSRVFGAWLTHELVLDFIPEREWPMLLGFLSKLAKGTSAVLDDERGKRWRIRLGAGDSEPAVTRPYAQAPYLRVSMSVVKEEL